MPGGLQVAFHSPVRFTNEHPVVALLPRVRKDTLLIATELFWHLHIFPLLLRGGGGVIVASDLVLRFCRSPSPS
jgi:hypothetical protein